ncbi:MAG TPA: TolC family protein [Ideonella sp.]|uniref:TolC family protein n=1 Tax=Ideonella sp. TaxID=1929293 RepID=UPI002BEA8E07|nr:TolC family protein [Ideonella sp.]HSI48881.1 TolC family protein [Ideonella sp.]
MRTLLLPLGLAATLLSPFLAQAQPASPLTLEKALQLASTGSPVLSAARRELEASDGALQQAGTFPNPALNASVEDTRRATRTTTATLDFPIELGGKRQARVTAAERGQDLARAELGNAQAQLRATVVASYFSVLLAQARVQLADDSAALATRAADAIAKRVAAGKVSPVDETRARVDQANAQLEAAEAVAELQAARHGLAALWGDEQPGFSEVTGDASQLPSPAALPELRQQLDASPALQASRIEASRRQAMVEVERSKAVPDITLSLGAKRDNELGRTQAVIGVSIPLPLFDRNQGSVLEAGRRALQAEDAHRATRLRLLGELQQATGQLALARSSVQTLQDTVLPAAQRAFDAASQGFEAGKFGFIDVIDAQRALLQARSRYLNTLSGAHQAAATIDRLLGR